MECISCSIFSIVDAFASGYAWQVFETITPYVRHSFNIFTGVWIAWTAIAGVVRGRLELAQIMSRLLLFVLISVALHNPVIFREWIYDPARESMSGVTQLVVRAGPDAVIDPSFNGMLAIVEKQITGLLNVGTALIRESGLTSLDYVIAGALLIAPFLFVWGIFLAFMLEGIFKMLVVTAMGPLLMALVGFKPTRGFAMSGARILVNGVLVVVFAGIAMGMTAYIVDEIVAGVGLFDERGNLTSDAREFVWSKQYWGLFLVGLISVLFHLKSATLAANISGAMDGPGAAAAVVSAGMAGAGVAKGVALWAGGRLGGAAGRAAGEAGGAALSAGRAEITRLRDQIVANWNKGAAR